MNKITYCSLNEYLKAAYGKKVYKLSIDGGFTCPNRDGSLSTKGCTFCAEGGSGDFSGSRGKSIKEQLEAGKLLLSNKLKNVTDSCGYIAYFQTYTNTYADIEVLDKKYREALAGSDIVALSIGTRPDCISEEIAKLLYSLKIEFGKDIWIELGLQTIHDETALAINRGYALNVYDNALKILEKYQIKVVTHVILGLPNETKEQMLETVKYIAAGSSWGIKLSLLHVLKGTPLYKDYEDGIYTCLEMDEYVSLIKECLKIIPKTMVVHRITGDGDRRLLAAPLWSLNKKKVLNTINRALLS